MGLLDRFRRKKENESSRVARLLQTGRIVDGKVLDVTTDGDDKVVQIFYCYNVAGVEYESSQVLNADQRKSKTRYIPGAQVIIRYDPRQAANSVVV
jgi:hypothetical protein